MNITDFGPTKPTIQPYQNGYSIPVSLTQIERPGVVEGTTEYSWQGYLLTVAALTELEFDEAIKQLPAGDYSADKQAALEKAVYFEQRAALDVKGALLDLQQLVNDLTARIQTLEGGN
jgi:hypothetical protein